jgi:hypothetical protein
VVKKEGICHASKKVDVSDYCLNVQRGLWEPRGMDASDYVSHMSRVTNSSSLVSLQ